MCVSCAFSLLFIILNSALFAFLSTYLFFREREKDATQPGREVGRKWKKLWEEKTVIRIDCMKSFVFLANKKKTCLPNSNKLYKSKYIPKNFGHFKTTNSELIPGNSLSSILTLISKNETEIELYSHIFCFVLSGALRKSPKVMLSVDQSGHHKPGLFHNSENSDNSDQ